MTTERTLRDHLAEPRALFGFMQTVPNPTVSEMAGVCGYDFIILDGEHGVFNDRDFLGALQAIAATHAFALVRLPKNDPQLLGRYLDMGVDGIIAPNVSTAEQARVLSRAMEYPPAGTRGLAMLRAARYGIDFATHLKAPRAGACLLPTVESVVGVQNVEEILAVEGVDGVFIGPFDLSADLGCAGDFSQPGYSESVARVERAALSQGKLLGTGPHPGHSLETLIARGHRLLLLGGDIPLMCEAMRDQLSKARSILQSP